MVSALCMIPAIRACPSRTATWATGLKGSDCSNRWTRIDEIVNDLGREVE